MSSDGPGERIVGGGGEASKSNNNPLDSPVQPLAAGGAVPKPVSMKCIHQQPR